MGNGHAYRKMGAHISKELSTKVRVVKKLKATEDAKKDIQAAFSVAHVESKVDVEVIFDEKIPKVKVIGVEYEVTWLKTTGPPTPDDVVESTSGAEPGDNRLSICFVSVDPTLRGTCQLSTGHCFENPKYPDGQQMSDRYAALMVQKVFRAKKAKEAANLNR